jgi:hypothetical protein
VGSQRTADPHYAYGCCPLKKLECASRRQLRWIACLLNVPFNRQDLTKRFPSNNKFATLNVAYRCYPNSILQL